MELFQPTHLLVLAIIAAILFFGWKQMPDMARSLGRSLRVFKTEIKGLTEDDKARENARDTQDGAHDQASLPTPAIEAPRAQIASREVAARADASIPSLAKPAAESRPRPRPAASTPPRD